MKKKSILFVVNNFNIGGPQKSLLSLLHNLNLDEYEVDLLSLSNSGSLLKYLPSEVRVVNVDSVVSYSILSPNNIVKKSLELIFTNEYKKPIFSAITIIRGFISKKMVQEKQKYWVKIRNTLPKLEKNYDYAFGVSGGHSIMYIADCVKAKKKIGWIRSDYRVLKRNLKIDQIYFDEMDLILSVSEMCKDIFVELFPNTEKKVQVFYNMLPFKMYDIIPADTSIMKNEKSSIKTLSICRLDPNKGLDLALETLEILLKKNLNVKWFVLGDGMYREKLEKIIREKHLENNFVLLGFQINTAEFIKQADIIVHPSRFEGKSNVVDEAKYLLKPIVATRYNTVSEQLIHKKTGLIAEMNPDSIAHNIEKILYSSSLKKEIICNLKKSKDSDAKSLEQFYNIIDG